MNAYSPCRIRDVLFIYLFLLLCYKKLSNFENNALQMTYKYSRTYAVLYLERDLDFFLLYKGHL